MGGGRFGGEEVPAEGERGPADGGDERGEGIGGISRRDGERKSGNELEGAGVEDGNGAAGREGQEARGAEVRGSEVVAVRWAREHAVPRLLGCMCRP